jgi:hypothetical protein
LVVPPSFELPQFAQSAIQRTYADAELPRKFDALAWIL